MVLSDPTDAKDTILIYTLIIFSILNTTLQFPWFFGFWPGADLVGVTGGCDDPDGPAGRSAHWAIALAMPPSGGDYVCFASSTKLAAVVEGADKAVTWRHYAALALFYSSLQLNKVSNTHLQASIYEEKTS